jgi:hypothetical protein
MICDEAAEHISALYDGETIPRHAAEHIGECEGCRAQLRDYMELERSCAGLRAWKRRWRLREWFGMNELKPPIAGGREGGRG